MPTVGGALPSGQWLRVVNGWGYFSVEYGLSASVVCDFRCYSAPVPFPVSSGTVERGSVRVITHRVVGYGDIWLRGHGDGSFALSTVGP